MSEWPKHIDRHWFVIAHSGAVTNRPHRVTLFGRRWALARDRENKVLVLEDRCPHRHAPLSAGDMTGEGLRCPYHGWTFNRSGSCVSIPGWPDGDAPPEVRVPSLAVVEHDGLVWAAAHPVSQVSLPRVVTTLEPGSRRFLWQTKWGAPILEALENFLDALHTHLIHPGLVRCDSARHRVSTTLRRHEEGFTRRLRRGGRSVGHPVSALRVEANGRAGALRRTRRGADRISLRERLSCLDHALLHPRVCASRRTSSRRCT